MTTVLPGADPEAIERTVTKPLEEALNTLPALDTLRSVNLDNVSQIIIRFDLERNVDVAAQDVRDRVQATLSKLPREIETPDRPEVRHRREPRRDAGLLRAAPHRAAHQGGRGRGEAGAPADPGRRRVELVGGRKREITIVAGPAAPRRATASRRTTWCSAVRGPVASTSPAAAPSSPARSARSRSPPRRAPSRRCAPSWWRARSARRCGSARWPRCSTARPRRAAPRSSTGTAPSASWSASSPARTPCRWPTR